VAVTADVLRASRIGILTGGERKDYRPFGRYPRFVAVTADVLRASRIGILTGGERKDSND
jgi:hypothetical protein